MMTTEELMEKVIEAVRKFSVDKKAKLRAKLDRAFPQQPQPEQ
jgi:hypothetical protein